MTRPSAPAGGSGPTYPRRAVRSPFADAGERGSGTLWTMTFAMLLIVTGVVAATIVSVAGAGRRADTAADLSALSAAARPPAAMGSACRVARQVAEAHRARLTACSLAGDQVEVVVEVQVWGLGRGPYVVRSRARAARSMA
jgi:secretion/DNA translocation related TadE-like protein